MSDDFDGVESNDGGLESDENMELMDDEASDELFEDEASEELCNGVEQDKKEEDSLTSGGDFEKDEFQCKTDDSGNIYVKNDNLLPDNSYELNGNTYKTDDKGRIVSCTAKPVLSPENPRDSEAQLKSGGTYRRENDQGGHIVGRDMNGDGGVGNLIPMDSKINQSDYKRMEHDVKSSLEKNKEVTTQTDITYTGDSQRPDSITTRVTVDGKDTVYRFDNNLDGSLRAVVPENGRELVDDTLEETGGVISSIKESYDEKGNLQKTEVCITYTDENGKNQREKQVIENK